MLKNKTALSLSPLALLTLAACGSSSVSVKGIAQNGPLEDAWAFLDLHTVANPNGDGKFNAATEVRLATATDGSFTLTDLGASDYTLAIETTGTTVDTVSGEAYGAGVVLKAPEGATMVTPATTMVNAVMIADGVTAAEAMADVAVALGFDAALDLNNFDAYKAPTGTAAEIAAAKTVQFAMQTSNQQVMSVVKSFAKAGESAGVSSADAYDAAISAVISVVEAKVDQINLGVASGGATTLLNFTNDMATVLTNVTTNVQAATGYEAAKAASFTAIAADAKTGLDVAVAQIKALVEPTGTPAQIATIEAANAKVISAANVVATQIAEAAEVIVAGGSLAAAQAKVTISDTASFNAVANNPAPTGMTLSGSTTVSSVENVTIAENATSLVVGTVAGTDGFTTAGVAVAGAVAANETFTYEIVGGPTVAEFTINSTTGVLSLVAQPDYETKTSYDVSVKVTDSGGKSVVEAFKVNISDIVEGGAFGISTDTVMYTDYNPEITGVGATAASDVSQSVMTSTTGSQVSVGSSGYGGALNLQNLKNLFDDDASTIGKSPNLQFTLDTVPTGSGTATIKATIIDGTDGTRTTPENEISVTVNVAYFGDGTTATISVPAGTATGSYTNGAGTAVSFTIDNATVDAFSVTAGVARTGTQATLDVELQPLYEAFITGAGRADLLQAGNYSIALETTLPLQNYANETVTKFTGLFELEDGNTKDTIVGTDGADTITGTSGAEVIVSGAGKDTIATGGGADFIVLATGSGSTTLANSNTVSDFTDGTDKFAIDFGAATLALAFAELTVAADATTAADTVISKGTEYLMTVTGVAYGYIDINDFVLASDIA